VITLTTIGFGEIHELSPAGRGFTIGLVLFGLSAAATLATQFARLMVEGQLSEYWRKRIMERAISRLSDHVIVCGFGRIGKAICHELNEMGAVCVVIEMNERHQDEARAAGHVVLPGNATSDAALLSAGVRRAGAVVAALNQDTDNVFVALTARDLNPEIAVIARAEDPTLESRMLKAGVSRVVYPAQLGGGRIAHLVGQEIGLDTPRSDARRGGDTLGYTLKIYRNRGKTPQSMLEVEARTGALRALALVDRDGHRLDDPPPEATVGEMEAVVLLVGDHLPAPMAESPHLEPVPETCFRI